MSAIDHQEIWELEPECIFWPEQLKVFGPGGEVDLTPQPRDLLLVLVRLAPAKVSVAKIMDTWGPDSPVNTSLQKAISRLRLLIGSISPRFEAAIQPLKGHGYDLNFHPRRLPPQEAVRFVQEHRPSDDCGLGATRSEQFESSGALPSSATTPVSTRASRTRIGRNVFILGLLILIALFGINRFGLSWIGSANATAHGVLVDEHNRVVSGVRIGIVGLPGEASETNALGEFSFPAHAAADHEIRIRVYDERYVPVTEYWPVSRHMEIQVRSRSVPDPTR